MNRLTYLLVRIGLLSIMTLLLSATQALANGCSDGSLSGSYAALYQGFIHPSRNKAPGQPIGGYVPGAALIVVTFDGNGGIEESFGGHLQIGTDELFFDVTGGEYSVNSDCTGTLMFWTSIPRPFFHTIVVTGDGEEYRFLRSLPPQAPAGIVQFGTARRMNLAE